jgi:hypothetical protein
MPALYPVFEDMLNLSVKKMPFRIIRRENNTVN